MANSAYDPKNPKNQYPKMLYSEAGHRVVEDQDAEDKAREEGYGDTPVARVAPKVHDGSSETSAAHDAGMAVALKALKDQVADLSKRLEAIEELAYADDVPGEKAKGKK